MSRRGTVCGTPLFMAPEVLVLDDDEPETAFVAYTAAADVWSLGVTIYVLLSGGVYPLTTRRDIKALAKGDAAAAAWRMPPLPVDVPVELSALVQVWCEVEGGWDGPCSAKAYA